MEKGLLLKVVQVTGFRRGTWGPERVMHTPGHLQQAMQSQDENPGPACFPSGGLQNRVLLGWAMLLGVYVPLEAPGEVLQRFKKAPEAATLTTSLALHFNTMPHPQW